MDEATPSRFPVRPGRFERSTPGVRIDVITTGQYPGDGQPKAVRFPDPDDVAVEIEGIRVVNLEAFVELKLASGTTAPHRLRDISDIQDLIRAPKLVAEFGDRLDESVRPMFRQLWDEAHTADQVVDL